MSEDTVRILGERLKYHGPSKTFSGTLRGQNVPSMPERQAFLFLTNEPDYSPGDAQYLAPWRGPPWVNRGW
jgi:hypothetical protein